MRVSIRKWGNSASIRIPGAMMSAARFQLDQQVEIREEEGRLVIEPVRPARYDLATLVAGITDENRHELIETGPPVGDEVW